MGLEQEIGQDGQRRPFLHNARDRLKFSNQVILGDDEFHGFSLPYLP
jgi:hypothetical protein